MPLGTIKKLLVDKHCGFICPTAGGGDVFFHGSVVAGAEFRTLMLGHRVEYDIDAQGPDADRGPRASRVRVLGQDKPAPLPPGEFRQLRRHPASRAKKPTWRKEK
ncbi:MAG TPA: cold shock domain-containing protein [Pirellulales bacterium]|nr:cold shock domain-containing protein [Pirellulales bacterium]